MKRRTTAEVGLNLAAYEVRWTRAKVRVLHRILVERKCMLCAVNSKGKIVLERGMNYGSHCKRRSHSKFETASDGMHVAYNVYSYVTVNYGLRNIFYKP